MTEALRWLLTPIAAGAVWCGVLGIGFVAIGALDRLCPPDLVISGACVAPWHAPAVDGVALSCTALAATGIVLAPAATAPRGRRWVALAAFAGGAVFASVVASGGGAWAPFTVAAIAGSLALRWAWSRWRPVTA